MDVVTVLELLRLRQLWSWRELHILGIFNSDTPLEQ